MSRAVLRVGGVLGLTGVLAGAYGSHMLEARWQETGLIESLDENDIARWKTVYKTAHLMHIFGACSMLALAPSCGGGNIPQAKSGLVKYSKAVPVAIGLGTLVFCGSTYAAAINAERKFGYGAPFGGMLLIAGFTLLLL